MIIKLSSILNTQYSAQKGFSLVETLVAITILLIAVVGPISLIGDSVHKIYYAKDEIIAINLAQEGIEAVRKVRDTNKLSVVAWDSGITAGYYIVDSGNISGFTSTLSATLLTTPQTVYVDTAIGGLYWQTNAVGYLPTSFSRIVRIEQISAGVENKITATVIWKTGGDTGTIAVSENLFNWAP